MIFTLYKYEGETPLEAIGRYKTKHPELAQEKMTYAGRLDPMAEGVLLILSREDTKRKEEFLGLEKEYEFEILWGISSDSFDVLGIPIIGSSPITEEEILKAISNLPKEITLPYPPFSSKTVLGMPLFEWFRKGRIDEIELPERKMKIERIEILENREIGGKEIMERVFLRIQKVKGDFRQDKIILEWKNILKEKEEVVFKITKLKATVSSGTYIRSLAEYLGKELGYGALAWSIKRTRVGEYKKTASSFSDLAV